MSHMRLHTSLRSQVSLAIASVATTAALVLAVVLVVSDGQFDAHAALVGLALAALLAVAAVQAGDRLDLSQARRRTPAENRRLRGGFRRQHRPDTPGRPMPRAPGSVT